MERSCAHSIATHVIALSMYFFLTVMCVHAVLIVDYPLCEIVVGLNKTVARLEVIL